MQTQSLSVMFPSFSSAIEQLDKAMTVQDVKSNCYKVFQKVGVAHFRFFWQGKAEKGEERTGNQGIIQFHNCPESWHQNYRQKGYALIDPKVDYCQRNSRPVIWQETGIGLGMDKNIPGKDKDSLQAFYRDYQDMRMGRGIVVPLQSRHAELSMLCATTVAGQWSETEEQLIMPWVAAYAYHVQEAVERIRLRETKVVRLSEREQEAVQWTARGLTASEVAEKLAVSERTVLYHLNNAKIKLGANNKPHLTARAVSLGLVAL